MNKIRNAVRRGSAFAAAASLLAVTGISAALPAVTSADPNSLNPLIERSLMLSSSSPGYHFLDGSGNSTYAGPGTGNNGKQTSETFSFKVTTDSSASGTNTPIKAFTFQYCTTPAGECTTPGNVGADGTDATTSSNLNINYTTPVEGTDFDVYLGGTLQTGWNMTPSRDVEHPVTTDPGALDNNFITLTNDDGFQPTSLAQVKVVFKASSTNYITNPGKGAFFVKVNDYTDTTDVDPDSSTHLVDGGVTVANVMNDSIWIQTKVLETMDFSVGTENPDTVILPGEDDEHGTCDAITVNEPLKMGDSTSEDSLSTTKAYDTHSYWRLSSNSSNGATVYYSGNTLSNTEGDQIAGMGTVAKVSNPGSNQFGLAVDTTADTIDDAHADTTGSPIAGFSSETVDPLVTYTGGGGGAGPTDYSQGAGDLVNESPKFAFDEGSLDSPVPFADENTDIIHCATGKMRYLANIAADTPAGVYTSKINYIASPEY